MRGSLNRPTLAVIAAIIAMLVAIVAYQGLDTLEAARADVLRQDLRILRDLTVQYRVDRGRYPDSLQALVEAGYLRAVPRDPITDSDATWVEVRESSCA